MEPGAKKDRGDVPQLLARGLARLLDRVDPLEEHAPVLPEDRLEHLVLGREVVVEQTVRDARLLGDVADPRRVKALAREHADGGVENLAPLLFGAGRPLAQGRRRVVVASRGMQAPEHPGGDARRRPDARAAGRVRLERAETPRGAGRPRRAAGRRPDAAPAPAWHDALNAGKESVLCELPRDRELARALLARADVVLESFRPGVAARLGIGPADVPRRAVYCSITGFGLGGRHEQRAGHDLNYLGWAGVLAATAPALPPVPAADLAAGASAR